MELKSLLPNAQYSIFTATATKSTKMAIFDMLDLSLHDTFCIEKEPTRSNSSYYFIYVEKCLPFETIFSEIINELKAKKQKTERTIIFCQTRKQCSLIYRMFVVALGDALYASEGVEPNTRLVEMYHAGTPESVKTYVINEIGKYGSQLRLIICTVAFGMGIDCKDMYRSIHFGPPKTVELLVQECGRIGRDGMQCICYVLYNGLLTSYCNEHMKELITSKSCRRQSICKLFTDSSPQLSNEGCCCCDNCAHTCKCANPVNIMDFGKKAEEVENLQASRKREVTDMQRQMLNEKLVRYRKSLLPKNVKEFIPVGTSSVLFEFGFYQIEQVMNNCHALFNMEDILSKVELWRHVHANNIYVMLSETFKDMCELDGDIQMSEEEFKDREIVLEDWEDIRDDSSMYNSTIDISADANMDSSFENNFIEDSKGGNNISGIIQSMTNTIDLNISNG